MDEYTQLARKTAENFVKTGEIINSPQNLPEVFYNAQKAVFVTIHKHEENNRICLRGCIGTLEPTKSNIAEEIIQNAIWACRDDNRFLPVTEKELDKLTYEVSLLDHPEQIYSTQDLDPKKYGVIIRTEDGRTGLLLPDIEGVESPLHQVEIAARKGCIDVDRDEFSLFRFTVEKHKE